MSEHQRLAELAEKHLWGHFSVLKNDIDGTRVIERGQGCHVWDAEGNRYLDGLAGLFVSQLGHGRPELARAAGDQRRPRAVGVVPRDVRRRLRHALPEVLGRWGARADGGHGERG